MAFCHDEVDIVEYIARLDGIDCKVKDPEGNNTRRIACELVGIDMKKHLIALNEHSAIFIDIEYNFHKNKGGKSPSSPSAPNIKMHVISNENMIYKDRLKKEANKKVREKYKEKLSQYIMPDRKMIRKIIASNCDRFLYKYVEILSQSTKLLMMLAGFFQQGQRLWKKVK